MKDSIKEEEEEKKNEREREKKKEREWRVRLSFYQLFFKELFLMKQLKRCPISLIFLNILLVFFSNGFGNKGRGIIRTLVN